MFKTLKRFLAGLAAVIIILPVTHAQAATEFMPIDQVVKGMHGTAKTVISGSKIEEFGVEVLGVMKQKGPSGDLILIRTYGDLIERTGGIAQGMSGSPVYINGKLVGAIAYGWPLTDHKTGMVTPIADMLKLWELNDGQTELGLPEAEAVPDNRVSTPLMVSGFGQQALNLLADKLKPYNLIPYAVNGSVFDANNGIAYKTVEPGGTVGVQLVRGDVSVGALGTVTYVEGDKILAFGHPFLKRGKANYFLTDAQVYTVLNSLENSFKVGTSTETIGIVNQDRGVGIAGQLGRFPGVVPLRISVTDNTLGRTNDLWAQVVQDEEISPILSAVSIFNAIEKTTDRIGSGTARVNFEISAADIPGGVLKRDNMFYTQGNIGELAVAEVHESLVMLASNQFTPVTIMDVKVNITVDNERRTASIAEARVSAETARPGDKVEIAVQINPFRDEPTIRHITYTVPEQQPPGSLLLSVRGGGMVSMAQIIGKAQNGQEDISKLFAMRPRPKSLNEAINELANRDRNNDIVVEAIDMSMPEAPAAGEDKNTPPVAIKIENTPAPMPPTAADKQPAAPARSNSRPAKAATENTNKVYITTDYIIDGETQVMLNITK